MKRLLTTLMCALVGGAMSGQWTPATAKADSKKRAVDMKPARIETYFKLDLDQLRSQLRGAQEMGANSKPVVVSIPTLDGKIQKFNVYSFPVIVKELADQYQLGSYVGTSVDDPTQQIRFSIAPNDFQSMLFKDGAYEFIDPVDKSTGLYGVHPKTNKSGDKPFACSTTEKPSAIQEIQGLYNNASSFAHQPGTFSRSSDKKYRTMRLALSVTGEYTAYFGGLTGAMTAINATMTRVNGVFEKDFALHLNLQNYPGIIYTNAATDPYSDADDGVAGAWNAELMNVLHNNVGETNFDIGHLFGASGGGGNAGCIGCVCSDDMTLDQFNSPVAYKGSGYTSPANGNPSGDAFDIDYVAHEMGHQLGANHTFSHKIEGTGVNVEPGSGSTIMGYAGITGANTDVQAHSDPYFHKASIGQVQTNLGIVTCDIETSIANNPPVIAALSNYTIPKKTAFVLTANVTDPENDPMTYTWEEMDTGATATQTINKTNIGTTTYGASFRSVPPTTSPTRYFPKFSSVLAGVLNNSLNTWESTSQVARTSKFAITARDNNADVSQQQTNTAQQTITVGNDGPFQITQGYLYTNVASNLTWDVANTSNAPYNSANVKIEYSTDNGTTWTVLSASTPNDGTESFTMPASLNGQFVVMKISSIGNVFYALKKVYVDVQATCGSAPLGTSVSNILISGGSVNWAPVSGATSYAIQYKKTSDVTWTQATSTTNSYTIAGLLDCTSYQIQVAAVCSGNTGPYSTPVTFSTTCVSYCTASSTDATYLSISNLQVANINNPSGPNTYTDFTANTALQGNLVKGTSYPVTITATLPAANFAMVFIDYNKDGVFASNERVVNFPVANTSTFTGSFTVPATGVVEGQPLRMRVMVGYAGSSNIGLSAPAAWACGEGNFYDGEVEDYNVVISSSLSTSETGLKNDGIQIYPNPVSDILNVTKVSDKATYKIYSAAGQLVNSGAINGGRINVSALVKGGYMITIDDKGMEQFKSKFIKK
ncbi:MULTISPECIES: reprolysin-like metallopeptidase [unclassified Chryseobacterium]|uniref:reprolysin-like metallopeptidase n=1 Tax=unclassified Chryseobacterium TaxID=2593645 RepID=UPI000F450E93|nr:zinc-dependent metalloprotease family protein [Chryseobacterium sp. G0240]ROI01130.1 T9SS C-terminal target domain-containing protein [Chryseobacterium sp. G0240]